MPSNGMLSLNQRSQKLVQDANGYTVYESSIESKSLRANQVALVLCDVWDRHWCRGAEERLAKLLPRMKETVQQARNRGVLIVHAPSETMDFYKDTPARRRVLAAPEVSPPMDADHPEPPLPIDASDSGGDTPPDSPFKAWNSQHPAIEIDQDVDVISDDGRELYSLYSQMGIRQVLLMGVHTNMCILNRTFSIKQMVRWGMDIALIRDLTDAMYNPAMPPYVSHEEGTQLVVGYIEKFWCPSILSQNLFAIK